MENSAKEKRQYIIINVLLILIVLLLGVYIYKVIQSNKQQIKVGYEQGVNVVQQLQDEYINVEKVETTENQDTMIVPIIDSYSGEYNFNVVTNNKYYYNQDLTGPLGIVIGNEGKGISTKVKKNCDFNVKIPMKGKIKSLNASVSTGIIVYEAMKQRIRKK